MNLFTTILNLFKKADAESSGTNQRWLDGYHAFEKGKRLFHEGGQLQGALACFDEAIGLGCEDAEILGMRGSCLQSLNFDLDAIDDFDKAIALNPEDTHLYFMRSVSKGGVGDLQGRVTDLQETIRVAAISNAGNRTTHELARERGFKDLIEKYQMDIVSANLDVERQAIDERMAVEFPGRSDLASRRRAAARRRSKNE